MTNNNGAPEDIQGGAVKQEEDRFSDGTNVVDQFEVSAEPKAEEPGDGEAVVEDVADEDEVAEPSDTEIIAHLREELTAAQALADESFDKLQRTAAEFQNTRKRQERQLADAIDRANADLIRRLLPVLDDLDMAFASAPETDVNEDFQAADLAWVEGFRQIRKKLLDLLEDHGVTPIEANGEFDPMLHEAVLSEPSDEVESGHIIGVLRTGYEFKGQVLRPVMVRVAA